jgi:GPH family glycoside/pentoside/hexuronide:cation symporter
MDANRLRTQKLPLRTKFVYGIGDWGTSAATMARNLFWLFFIVSVVGMRAEIAGIIILIGRVWDSFNDPLIGFISDRVNTRWGRRRPFFLVGAVPFGITFFLLFFVPPIESELGLAIYYALVYLIFDTMFTVINVPYAALTPELTEDYDERSSLAGWRIAIAILASLIVGATFRLLAEDVIAVQLSGTMGLENALRLGYAVTAALWAVTLVISPLILFMNIKEPQLRSPDTSPFRPLQLLKEVYSNRPFRLAATIYLLSFTAADIVVAVFVWFLVFYIGAGRGFDSLVIALVLGLAFLTMPITVKLMRRFDKRSSYMGTMAIYAIVLLIMSQIPHGGETYVIVAALFAGFGHGAVNVIPWAMVADVVDVDELNTGKRREGLYSGFLVFLRKLATAIAIFTVTWLLAATGFVGGTTGGVVTVEQPESALTALRVLVSVVPAFMLALSILVAWRYPLTREAHAQIMRDLAIKRAEALEG